MNNNFKQMDIFDYINDPNISVKKSKEITDKKLSSVDSISLNSLMKTKFGISKTPKLKVNINDDTYTVFKKIAKYIYRNGKWNSSDLMEAADTLFLFLGFTNLRSVSNPFTYYRTRISAFMNKEQVKELGLDDGKGTYNYVLRFSNDRNDKKGHYLVITDNYASNSRCSSIYHFKKDPSYNFTYISAPLLLGYGKLVSDILENFNTEKDPITNEMDLTCLLRCLIAGKNTDAYINYQRLYNLQKYNFSKEDMMHSINLMKAKLGRDNLSIVDRSIEYIDEYLKMTYCENNSQQKVAASKF
ncbi:hypothetical protein [Lactobacillus taiwanensis]|jgi:hypothetical protein|uniref:hypothetical protein n=1 Tax=Lactobacillus taiwanensis TaxID=508451 RepID=UPI001AEC27C1|nr:hypothetical protein [Lactobacillus taiwanensis]MCR1903899.1 hypothetical protein [Lactobacillus taiwanensis]QTQ40853.1 hypothetical protein H1A07_09905 [Lactobacillus taiwanensis]